MIDQHPRSNPQQIEQHRTQLQNNECQTHQQTAQPEKIPFQKTYTKQPQKNRIKSRTHIIMLGLISSLSALMLGYSLLEITSIPIQTLVAQYNISMRPASAHSLLIGILPLGSLVGAVITNIILPMLMRRTGLYIFTVVNFAAILLVNITNFPVLVAGRFIEGICIGHYSAIAPIYCKEIAPKQLRKTTGLLFSIGKVLGVLIAIALQLALEDVQISWRIILSMTAVFSVIQSVLIFLVGFHSPAELIQKGRNAQAMGVIRQHFFQEYAEQIFNEYMTQYLAQARRGKEGDSKNKTKYQKNHQETPREKDKVDTPSKLVAQPHEQKESLETLLQKQHLPQNTTSNGIGNKSKPLLSFQQKKNLAFWVGIHICWLRHFTGGNVIASQGGLFIKNFNQDLDKYTPLIIDSIQLVFAIFGLVYITGKVGKRPQLLVSTASITLLNFALVISMILQEAEVIIILMCVFIAIYGAIFISLTWAYPPEVIPASQSLAYNATHWLAMAISTLVPPLVTAAMPDNNPYPVFIFFGVSSFLGFLHIWRYLRQSNNLTFAEIIDSYE